MELNGFLTSRGAALRAAAVAGTAPLTFTRFAAGSGATAPAGQVLDQERQALTAGTAYPEGETVVIPVLLTAARAQQAYALTEVGVYARDGEGESLYCVYRADAPLDISPASPMTVRFELEELFSQGLEVQVNPADTVRREELGAPNGVATLDGGSHVPVVQMPYTYGTEDVETGSPSTGGEGSLHFVYE